MEMRFMKTSKRFGLVALVATLVVFGLVGCSSVKYVTPEIPKVITGFDSLPAQTTEIIVNDLRTVNNKDKIAETLKKHLEEALSNDSILSEKYSLTVTILEYGAYNIDGGASFMDVGTWEAKLNIQVELRDSKNSLLDSYDIKESSIQRNNFISTLAAKSASQTVYDNVIVKIIKSVNDTLRK